jgi:GGDEF domain-containing protein
VTNSEARDRLTGLPGGWWRRPGPEAQEPWLASLPADAVILGISVRGLGAVNAQFGTPIGNTVLAEFAHRLEEASRPWTAYREGGDEFIVAARLAGEVEIRAFATRVRASLDRPYGEVTVRNWAVAAMASPGQPASSLVMAVGIAQAALKRVESSDFVILPPGSDGRSPFPPPRIR